MRIKEKIYLIFGLLLANLLLGSIPEAQSIYINGSGLVQANDVIVFKPTIESAEECETYSSSYPNIDVSFIEWQYSESEGTTFNLTVVGEYSLEQLNIRLYIDATGIYNSKDDFPTTRDLESGYDFFIQITPTLTRYFFNVSNNLEIPVSHTSSRELSVHLPKEYNHWISGRENVAYHGLWNIFGYSTIKDLENNDVYDFINWDTYETLALNNCASSFPIWIIFVSLGGIGAFIIGLVILKKKKT